MSEKSLPPPHARAIIGLISTLAVIEKESDDHAAKTGASLALESARSLSPELQPIIDAIRTTMNR